MNRDNVQTMSAGEIELAYETFGDPANPPLVLVMGLATQMLGWPDEFCMRLADAGLYVVRFDNRDIGLSTHMHEAGQPDLSPYFEGKPVESAYVLADMADDTAALLDGLGLDKVHIVGASMGGMIVQEVAMRHPQRLHTLTSIMSTPSPTIGAPTAEAGAILFSPPATSEDEAVERAIATYTVIGSPGFDLDIDALTERARESYRRAHDPAGVARQLAAIWASGDRTEGLREVDVPTLVIHGEGDPLVQIEGGRATAEAVPGARLVTYAGMGHDFPRELWPEIVDEITKHAGIA